MFNKEDIPTRAASSIEQPDSLLIRLRTPTWEPDLFPVEITGYAESVCPAIYMLHANLPQCALRHYGQ